MDSLSAEIAAFLERGQTFARRSRRAAALQLIGGINFETALSLTGEARESAIRRIRRLIERERLRGVRGHDAYDLDRHIALKESLDDFAGHFPSNENGARRRR